MSLYLEDWEPQITQITQIQEKICEICVICGYILDVFLYLFGLPAAGKNYVGQVLAEEFGYTFYDGDLDLTDELRDAVRDGRPFTDPMRDRFYDALVARIAELRRGQADLAFCQATFKERHRAQMAAAFPDVVFVLVEASEAVRLARLARGGNPVTVDYAQRIAAFFEPPQHPHFIIHNEGSRAAVVAQLSALLGHNDAKYTVT